MFEKPNLSAESASEKTESSSLIPGKIRRAIQGAALGFGLLGAEAATNEAEAQSKNRVEHNAEQSIRRNLFEMGKKTIGNVFERDGKLYVVTKSFETDSEEAIADAENQAASILEAYKIERLNKPDSDGSVETLVSTSTINENHTGYEAYVLVQMTIGK
jgi:hypothetical protein